MNKYMVNNRNCPTCGSINSRMFKNSKLDPTTLDFPDLLNLFVGFRRNQCFFEYYKCSSCNTLYSKDYFTQESLNQLYSNMPDNTFGLSNTLAFRTQEGYAKKIIKHIEFQRNIKLLEIGPDLGLFAMSLNNFIKVNEMTFIEPNIAMHDRLKKNLMSTGAKVSIFTDLSEVPTDQQFDLVVGIHVLDHLINPKINLLAYKNYLTKEGVISFVTHDYNSILRILLGRKWHPFCLQHPQLYSTNSLSHLADQTQLKLVKTYKTTNWLDLDGILARILSIFDVKNRFPLFRGFGVPLKIGNILTIFKMA